MSQSIVQNLCVLCDGLDSVVMEVCKDGYKILKCLKCGFVYVNPIPPKGLLEKAYSDEYYEPWLGNQRGKRISMWESRLKTLNSFSARKGNLLDIGCGEGLFLEIAKRSGWHVTGTEISSFAVKYSREKLGLDIYQGEITDIGFPDKVFDAITMWHVLEHTTNLVAVLKEIRRVLKNNSVLILAIPNIDNILSQWIYRLVKGKKMHLFDPEDRELHLYHFTPKTIRLALEKTGFRIEKIVPDMGIIQCHIRILNQIARISGILIGRIITDAIEVHAIPS
jgi:2-polyprenyl-3-methyl-5-hydroxy-6-metoxy-1,4-benzoquinol methylase